MFFVIFQKGTGYRVQSGTYPFEQESHCTLPFLDLLIIRNPDDSISIDWYTKPTYSGRLLHYHSSHPHHQKLNVAKNLISRCFTLSDPQYHETNKSRITNILSSNGFPQHTIKNLIQNCKIPNPSSQHPTLNPNPPFQYRSVPYIPSLSEKLQKTLKTTFPNLRLGFQSKNQLRNIYSNLKDPIPHLLQSNLVYQIPCATPNCNASYIGETKNYLKTRIQKHQYDIRTKNTDATKLSEHAITLRHNFDFDNTTRLTTQTNHTKRLIAESIHIHLQPNPVNSKKDKEFISSSYSNIFRILKK